MPGRNSCFAFKRKNEEGIFRKVDDELPLITLAAVVKAKVKELVNL